jgi:hypothetical protein
MQHPTQGTKTMFNVSSLIVSTFLIGLIWSLLDPLFHRGSGRLDFLVSAATVSAFDPGPGHDYGGPTGSVGSSTR